MSACVIGDAERTILTAGHPSISLSPVSQRDVLPVAYERQAVFVGQSVFDAYPNHCLIDERSSRAAQVAFTVQR